jgi:hypothetical protein
MVCPRRTRDLPRHGRRASRSAPVRRIAEAKFPHLERLAEFNLDAVPSNVPGQLAALAAGGWIDAGEPVVLLSDSGTGEHCAFLPQG